MSKNSFSRRASRKNRRASIGREGLERLESRELLTLNVTEFPIRYEGGASGAVAVLPADGSLWFTLPASNNIGTINPKDGSTKQFAIPTPDSSPGPITYDPSDGAFWFGETAGNQIGRIDPKTGVISEFPLLATADAKISGITADSSGTVWFTEYNANQIGRIDPKSGLITELSVPTAGGQPLGITATADGSVWFTESSTNQIGMINTITDHITEFPPLDGNVVAGDITAGPDGALWFTETGTNQIGRLDPKSGSSQSFDIPSNSQGEPESITSAGGNIWFTASGPAVLFSTSLVGMVDLAHQDKVSVVASTAGTFAAGPEGLAATPDGNLWITTQAGNQLVRMNESSKVFQGFSYKNTTPTNSITGGPSQIVAGPDGNLWFTQSSSNQVGKFDPTTNISTEFGTTTGSGPLGIAVGPDSNIWFTEAGAGFFSATGQGIGKVNLSNYQVTGTLLKAQNTSPTAIVGDPADGNLWFTDTGANQIGRIIPTSGALTEFPVPTANSQPTSITVDGQGNIWFTEYNTGIIGTFSPSHPNQIKSITLAADSRPYGITLGPDGNIWFTQRGGFGGSAPSIGKINISANNQVTLYPVGASIVQPSQIITGPDKNLWFIDTNSDIGMVTTDGKITSQKILGTNVTGIASGSDGNLWFTGQSGFGSSGANVIGSVILNQSKAASKLAVTTQPLTSTDAGHGFGLVVSVEDASGALVKNLNGTVTIALG
ncbi:Vgb family protein, partial [Singulisphaera rosea]